MAIQDYLTKGNHHEEPQFGPNVANVAVNERTPTRVKVIGVGGAGCNCVKRMLGHSVPGVSFAMVNTDIKSLETDDDTVEVIQIGEKETRGWGAGGDCKSGARAAEESSAQLRIVLAGAELVFITAGMGGGTGTGATPYVSYLAKEAGAFVVGVVTTPFSFEGRRRLGQAVSGIDRLRPYVDSLIMIHNDRLLTYVSHDAPMVEAFRTADEIVTQGIVSISELFNVSQEINADFADVRSVMEFPGGALMAIGKGNGSAGPVEAARQAIANPLLNLSITDATGVLLMVKGGSEAMTVRGANDARRLVAENIGNDAIILLGMRIDETLGQEVRLTLIATGLEHNSLNHYQSTSNGAGQSRNFGFGASLLSRLQAPRNSDRK